MHPQTLSQLIWSSWLIDMVHKEGPDTRYTTQVLNLVIRLRWLKYMISALFAWVRKLNRRTRRPGRVFCRVVRIPRAGCSRDRRLAGDSGIDHQLLGSGRRRFTIHKVWPAATEKLIIDSAVACRPPISATSRPWNAHDAAENAARPARPPIQLHHTAFHRLDRL